MTWESETSISSSPVAHRASGSNCCASWWQITRSRHREAVLQPDRLADVLTDVAIYEADLADAGAVERATAALVKAGPPIDVLINNAAVQNTPRFTEVDFRY